MKNQQTDETTKNDIQNPKDTGTQQELPKDQADVRDQDRTKDQGRERREHVSGDPKGSDR